MLSIPAELRGRVISIVNLSGTFSFLGGLAAGIASEHIGQSKAGDDHHGRQRGVCGGY